MCCLVAVGVSERRLTVIHCMLLLLLPAAAAAAAAANPLQTLLDVCLGRRGKRGGEGGGGNNDLRSEEHSESLAFLMDCQDCA